MYIYIYIYVFVYVCGQCGQPKDTQGILGKWSTFMFGIYHVEPRSENDLQMVGFPYRTVSFQDVFHVECHVFYSMDMFWNSILSNFLREKKGKYPPVN